MSRPLIRALACAAALAGAVAPPAPAFAQALVSETAPRPAIYVPRDKSVALRLDQPASRIVVAQTDIAEVIATGDRSFYVRGVEFGSTNLLIYGPGGRLQQIVDVRVGYDAAALQEDLRAALPGEPIQVRNLGEGLLLTGSISNTGVEARAKGLAERYAPQAVTSSMQVRAAQQVVLEVRVLEAGRSALQELGVNVDVFNSSFQFISGNGLLTGPPQGLLGLTGGSGSTTIDTTLMALEEKGIVRTLARPNLTALSGEKASFLAGGEFPFPVPQDTNTLTVEWRPYGVKLNFQPVVQDNGFIRLQVEPEVSQLDTTNALRVNNLTIPALTVRRAATTLNLRPGDSFAIAGLFQRDYVNSARQLPGLGEIPVLGALFRSARWKRNETELLIIVTARLASEADHAAGAPNTLPGREPTAGELLFLGRAHDKPLSLPGDGPPPR